MALIRNINYRQGGMLCLLGTLACAALILAACVGSVHIPLRELPTALRELWSDQGSLYANLLELRLSRALTAFVTGGALSLAGVMMQALLRNPLADPYVLGISAGAAVGALAAMVLMAVSWQIDAAAFGGSLLIAMLLYWFARQDLRSGIDNGNSLLLLTGVILASGCMALVSLMLAIAPEGRLRSMVFWMIGDLSGTEIRLLPWLALGVALIYALSHARSMNILAMHAQAALTLGVQVARLRQGLFFCAALLTASAVSTAGSIGFVGLIVPHACRFAFGADHRLLLPAATLVGGAFLVLADTVARTVVAPLQLPVGVITALIGVPLFLLQLHQLKAR